MPPATRPLDNPATYARRDPSGLRHRIASLPDQCRRAWEDGQALPLPQTYAGAQSVVLLGMGGSAIGGDLISGLASLEQSPPITVARDYSLPPWVGPNTLVLASSYSGNTEETLAMYRQARERGARLVAVTSGGVLGKLAGQDGVPLLRVAYQGEPRSALGYSFIAPLAVLCKLGILADKSRDLTDALQNMRSLAASLSPETPLALNRAKQVATFLHGMLAVVYGSGFLAGAARRWKAQLAENSKALGFSEELPELDHNSIQGMALPKAVSRRAAVVLLHSSFLHPRASLRYRVTGELLGQQGVRHLQLEAEGASPLSHLLTTCYLGDFASYYLAMLYRVDPAPTPLLDQAKERMARDGKP